MKRYILIIYTALFLVFGFFVLYTTQHIGGPGSFSPPVFYARLCLCILCIAVLLKLLHAAIKINFTERVKKYGIIAIAMLFFLLLTEMIFMFVSRSFGTPYPLADQNWARHYWHPINTLGYRDYEVTSEKSGGQKNILILGSSYTAGDGIKNIEDRFSDRLQKLLPDNYHVYNLGYCGSGTADAYERLMEFPVKPDILVLTHTSKSINDVAGAKNQLKGGNYRIDMQYGLLTGFIVGNSYLINYLFWKYYAPQKLFDKYLENINDNPILLYLQKEPLNRHLSDLMKFIDYSKRDSIPLLAISFPSLNNTIAFSQMIVCAPVEIFFEEQDIPVISVYGLVKDIPASGRTVNSNDAHPSVLVHQLIADELYKILTENKLIIN